MHRRFFSLLVILCPMGCFLLTCVAHILAALQHGWAVASDADSMAHQIDGLCAVTNWYSALVIWEGKWWIRCCEPLHLNSHHFFYFLSVVGSAAIYTACYLFFEELRKICKAIIYVIPFAYALVFLILNHSRTGGAMLRLDISATGFLLLAVTLAMCTKPSHRHCARMIDALLLLLLFQACCMRKPFLMLLPFILVPYAYSRYCSPYKTLKSVLTAGALSVTMITASILIPVQKESHPYYPMLLSDMRIASMLRGEFGAFSETYGKLPNKNDSPRSRQIVGQYGIYSITDFNQFRREYIECWRNSPESMLTARGIQTLEFITGEYVPLFIRRELSRHFPALNEIEQQEHITWPPSVYAEKPLFYHFEFTFCGMLILAGGLLPFALLFSRRARNLPPQYRYRAYFLALLTVLGILCYLVVVPTGDFRYRLHSLLFAIFSLMQVFAGLFSSREKAADPISVRSV